MTRKIEWSVDPKSYELAQHFLPNGNEESLRELSQDIQDVIENWFLLQEELHPQTAG